VLAKLIEVIARNRKLEIALAVLRCKVALSLRNWDGRCGPSLAALLQLMFSFIESPENRRFNNDAHASPRGDIPGGPTRSSPPGLPTRNRAANDSRTSTTLDHAIRPDTNNVSFPRR
jgi:hypothetical protein